MTRSRADDYDDKREGILDEAASLFAQEGYATARMAVIAERCGLSKSMMYYYFDAKEDVLAAIIAGYGAYLAENLDEIRVSDLCAEDKLLAFVERFIDKPLRMEPRHVIFLREARFLPPDGRRAVQDISGRILRQLGALLGEINPQLADRPDLLRLHARLLSGSLNAIDVWYARGGSLSPRALSEQVVRTFLSGFRHERPGALPPSAGPPGATVRPDRRLERLPGDPTGSST